MATGRTIPVMVGDIEVLAETVLVPGTEPTAGRAQQALENAAEVFGQAQQVIVEVAKSTAEVIQKAAARAARPDHIEIEFGLSFSASGRIVMVAGATAEATLRVLLSYDTKRSALQTDESEASQPLALGPAGAP